MHRRPFQHTRNCELFRGRSFAGLEIAEGAESLHGDGANRRCSDEEQDIHSAATLKQMQPLVRFLQMHHLAGLSRGRLRLIQPGDPPHHIRAGLEQVGELLPAILTGPAQLFGSVELHRRQRMILFQLIELNEVTVTDRSDDVTGAVMLVVGGVQHQEHADDRICSSMRVCLFPLKNASSSRGSYCFLPPMCQKARSG